MRTKFFWVLVAVVAAALAVASVGVGLTVLRSASTTSDPGVPVWHAGNSWTYNVTLAQWDTESAPLAGTILVGGQITDTVAGTVDTPAGSAYNVTEQSTYHLSVETFSWTTFEGNGTYTGTQTVLTGNASASGYAWYRVSDLALVREARSVHVNRSFTFFGGTVYIDYASMTTATFDTPVRVFAFPLAENETWHAASNASVDYASTFRLAAPNVTWSTDHHATFTVPVAFDARTGTFANVTVPAGTFSALPTAYGRFGNETVSAELDVDPVVNLAEKTIVFPDHAFGVAWFSDSVGNAVKATVPMGWWTGVHLTKVLVAYHIG